MKNCHEGMIPLFEIGATRIWAGGSMRGGYPIGLLINLSSNKPLVEVRGDVIEGEKLSSYTNPLINIDWEDFGVPNLPKAFWHSLIEVIRANPGDASVMCAGGHGRTGTAIAILGSLSGAIKGDHVKWVRKNYCEKAVESIKQIHYINTITGVRTKERKRETESTIDAFTQQMLFKK